MFLHNHACILYYSYGGSSPENTFANTPFLCLQSLNCLISFLVCTSKTHFPFFGRGFANYWFFFLQKQERPKTEHVELPAQKLTESLNASYLSQFVGRSVSIAYECMVIGRRHHHRLLLLALIYLDLLAPAFRRAEGLITSAFHAYDKTWEDCKCSSLPLTHIHDVKR